MESHETAEHFHIALTIQAAKPVKADSPGKKSNKAKKREPKGSFLYRNRVHLPLYFYSRSKSFRSCFTSS